MHSIAEVVIPPGADVVNTVTTAMEYFRTENDDGTRGNADWWDFWKIGGRFSGEKLLKSLDPAALERFYALLNERKVTVHGVQCGKPELAPPSQIAAVDALWREFFPSRGESCPLFSHGRDQYRRNGYYADDVCAVGDLPDRVTCDRLIVVGPHWNAKEHPNEWEPKRMRVTEFWNRVEWQKTTFDGNVKAALVAMMADELNPEVRRARTGVANDWLAVTVDYHN